MKDRIVKRLRNKAFLVALASAIILLIQQLGLNILPKNISDIVNTLLSILVTMGVVIDPTTPVVTDKAELNDPIEENESKKEE